MTGYSTLTPTRQEILHHPTAREFAMMPVWRYVYRYHNTDYEYYINGQTGKVYGKQPRSTGRILFSGTALLAGLMLFMRVLQYFVEVF